MFVELEVLFAQLLWRLTVGILTFVVRVFWRQIFIGLAIYFVVSFVVLPVIGTLISIGWALAQPVAVVAVLLLVLWFWRR